MKYILTETEYQEILASKKQAHEFLTLKEKEIADLSSKVHSLTKENQTYLAKIEEMKRDCEGTSRALRETQRVSAIRFDSMNKLIQEVHHLKAEHVCVVQNPKTGTVKVVSVVKADTYRRFGWTVSEEFLVDRPA